MESCVTEETPDKPAAPPAGRMAGLLRRLPRLEMVFLALALLWTLGAKLIVIIGQEPGQFALDVAAAWLPDFTFFAVMWLGFTLLYMTGWHRLAGRVTLLLSAVVLGWAVFNAAWLIATGAQLQPGVMWVLLHDVTAFWPIVKGRLAHDPLYAVAIAITLGVGLVWFVWRIIRPRKVTATPRAQTRWALIAAAVLVLSVVGTRLSHRGGLTAYSSQVIAFSSHWYALENLVRDAYGYDVTAPSRVLRRAGEVDVVAPDTPPQDRPNVVLIFLESVSYQASALGDPDHTRMPHMVELAGQGAEFVSTHVPIPMTDKAFWAGLTGTTPDVQDDNVESVITDEPYENLATILGRNGYRTGFFEMSRGSFKCAPGLFVNLDFDWAWFRENLEDPSAHIADLNGDDFRMIEPMFEWVDSGDEPFLLMMITTVSHYPYEMPDWYEHEPTTDRHEMYLQAVEFNDAFVAAVDAELAKRGLTDNTILCVMGDHGEGFRPESRNGRWAPFEEIIRIPWVMRWPGHIEAGARVDWPCSQMDVAPTILKLLGYQFDASAFEGKDALEPSPPDRRLYYMTWFRQSPIGYIEGPRKLVYWPYTDTLFEYDLEADPGENSPRVVKGAEREPIIADILDWQQRSLVHVPVHRFREQRVYDHWQVFSSGRSAWSYYVP